MVLQVFEVNASSKRTGRQILADLGEATQSHHLSTNHYGNNNSSLKSFFPSKSPSKTGDKKEVKKATPIPKAFAAFYKAGAKATSANQNTKTSKGDYKQLFFFSKTPLPTNFFSSFRASGVSAVTPKTR